MQFTENQAARETRVVTGLCIGCALRHHDFREILGRDDQSSERPLPEAWIDGRRYRLLPATGTEGAMCSDGNVSVPSIYLPAGKDTCF